jgi:hypothetical protein
MAITFTDEKHEYKSIEDDGIDWISATTLISFFKQPFDPMAQSVKSSKNKKSKWYGIKPEKIREIWEAEAKRATDLGTWYHNQREKDLCSVGKLGYKGRELKVVQPIVENGIKYAPVQKLEEACYPELLVYLKSAGICGQSDKTDVYLQEIMDISNAINLIVDISDYKTNKEIKPNGYKSWDGIVQKMLAPVNNLEDCNLNHYALQLSLYMYIILKHNPTMKPGKMTLHHIIFEEAGRDEYDYPISARNEYGEPIVKDIVYYDVPYLKDEVARMLNFAKNNRAKILAKKAA